MTKTKAKPIEKNMPKKKAGKFSSFVNNPIDFTLLITIILLLGIGLIMVLSASSPSALAEYGDSYHYFKRQLIFGILGIICMLAISKIDYRFYQKFYKSAWWISLALLIIVLIIGREVNGAQRWIYVTESLSVQPSEIVKFLIIIFYAGYLTDHKSDLRSFRCFCRKPILQYMLFIKNSILFPKDTSESDTAKAVHNFQQVPLLLQINRRE